MSRVHVWVDDFTIEALPDLVDGLAKAEVLVMRSFSRVPNPAMVGQLSQHRQVVMVGGRDFHQLVSRVEVATTTLRVGVLAVLPRGVESAAMLRGPGVVDVIPALTPGAARRVVLMSNVPIVSGARPAASPGKPRPEPTFSPGGKPEARAAAVAARTGRASELRALAIASSTGGCWVLAELLRTVPQRDFPVLLAQHLDGEFVGFFAEWLETTTRWQICVVDAPAALEPGVVYLPTGAKDLCVGRDGQVFAAPSSSRFIPSADRLFSTFAEAFGPRATGMVLSGMGSDGAAGLAAITRGGGRALCQLPATAIVPSMPESALRAAAGALAFPPELLSTALMLE